MLKFKTRYIINDDGKKNEVVIDIKDYQKILEDLEELESIRAYDAAKESKDEAIPFTQAINEIEQEKR
jgi:hypothetical protein